MNFKIYLIGRTERTGENINLYQDVVYFRLQKDLSAVTSAEREQSKRVVYSVMYGVGK